MNNKSENCPYKLLRKNERHAQKRRQKQSIRRKNRNRKNRKKKN